MMLIFVAIGITIAAAYACTIEYDILADSCAVWNFQIVQVLTLKLTGTNDKKRKVCVLPDYLCIGQRACRRCIYEDEIVL